MHDDLGSVSWWPICLWSTHLRLSPAVSLSMMFWHFLKLIFMYGCCREHLPTFTILMYAALISLTESPGDSWTAARCTFGKHELAGRGIASGVRLHLQSSFIQRRGWNEIRLDAVHSVVKGHHRPHVAPSVYHQPQTDTPPFTYWSHYSAQCRAADQKHSGECGMIPGENVANIKKKVLKQ